MHGVSTPRVEAIVEALGLTGPAKSQVSLICQDPGAEVERFRSQSLVGPYPSFDLMRRTSKRGRMAGSSPGRWRSPSA